MQWWRTLREEMEARSGWLRGTPGTMRHYLFYFVLTLFVLVVLIYYPLGMWWVHHIDDELDIPPLRQDVVAPTASKSVAVSVYLIEREVNTHQWTPNDPFILPGHMLERMPNYQMGMISALSRFAIELNDQIGRTRGSSQMDPDLEKAAGLLKYSPTVWVLDPSTSFLPTTSSETQYRAAARALEDYNSRLAQGKAVFESRSDNLEATLQRIANDMGASSAAIAGQIAEHAPDWLDTEADVLFYNVKGRMYAYYLLLAALEKDFAQVIREKQLENAWQLMLETFRDAAELRNFWIINGEPDSQFVPNHLANMGFFLLRGRTQIKEVASILQK